ncbi:hypothetical protein V2J09_019320 [Rumex salicifolius]
MEINLTFIDGSPTVYMSAQCLPDLSEDICHQCLNQSLIGQCGICRSTNKGSRTVSSSSITRYDVGLFYTSDQAWRLWNEDAELEMVDSVLYDAYSMEELAKCIDIGLLCIQEDAGKRPKMSPVVAALSGKLVDLPEPTPPNFFNISRTASVTSSSTSATTITFSTTTGGSQSSLLPIPDDE